MTAARVRLLVCGERLRGDDAAAVLAAERLPADVRALAEIRDVVQLDVDALLDIPDGTRVIVTDAAVGIAAGRVVTLPLRDVARSGGAGATPASSHALPPDQVLALAETLRGSLPEGTFVGIGGRDFGFGEALSAEVDAALPAFVTTLAAEIRRLAAD